MTYPAGETVTHLDGTVVTQDSDGNDARSYPTKATYDNVPIAPRDGNGTSSNEQTQGQQQVIVGLTIFLPDGVSVDATDRFTVRGDTFDVVGDPQAYVSPFSGWRPGVPVALQRVTG